MTTDTKTLPREERDRKAEHIELALERRMQVERNYFDDYRFSHNALPEIDGGAVRTTTSFLGRDLAAPLLISCMTGGTDSATSINRNLAVAAQERGIALGVGSQRKALEDVATAKTFEVRRYAPDVPVLANLGAVQLNYGYGLDECRAAVEMVEADALVLHLNPLQEALQPEGQVDFRNLLPKIEHVVSALNVPVIAKEVGAGLSLDVVQRLRGVGVRVFDTSGVGGTSWARIEAARSKDLEIGELFADWGVPTPQCLEQLKQLDPTLEIIASGGLRSGVDVAKSIALGAQLGALAYPFLAPALESAEAVVERIDRTSRELRTAMFCVGAIDLDALAQCTLERV